MNSSTIILFITLSITSCNRKDKSPILKEKICCETENTIANNLLTNDNDSYFDGNNIITSEQGPKVISRNILEDKKGNIWIASWDGIIKYDGKIFTNYTNKYNLRRYRIFSMLEDKEGNLWFGSIGAGVYKYDVAKDKFCNITSNEGLVNDKIGTIFQDSKGSIWFGTMQGLSTYNPKTQKNPCEYNFQNFTEKDGLNNLDVNSIAEDKKGRIWVVTRNGAYYYDGKLFQEFYTIKGESYGNTRTVISDHEGNLWFGGEKGLWKYNPNSESKISGKVQTNYSTDFIGYLYQDNKGLIWISSGNPEPNFMSLKQIDPSLPLILQSIPKEIIKQDCLVFGIEQDKNGDIWFGLSKGICKYDGKDFNYFMLD